MSKWISSCQWCFSVFFPSLVFLAFLTLSLKGIHPNLFVILLKSSKILASLGELSLLHALAHVPVDEGALGVHQVKLVVEPGPGLGDGGGVAQHADGPGHLGK